MTIRKDDWINLALNIREFHIEKIKEYGQRLSGYQVSDGDWSIRKTAQVYNISSTQCHDYLLIADKLLDKKSNVKNCKTKSEALRTAKRGK